MAECSHDWTISEKQVGTTDNGNPIIEVTTYCTKCGATA
jgi:hypothetical protein